MVAEKTQKQNAINYLERRIKMQRELKEYSERPYQYLTQNKTKHSSAEAIAMLIF